MTEPERCLVRYSPKLGGRFFLVCGFQPMRDPAADLLHGYNRFRLETEPRRI